MAAGEYVDAVIIRKHNACPTPLVRYLKSLEIIAHIYSARGFFSESFFCYRERRRGVLVASCFFADKDGTGFDEAVKAESVKLGALVAGGAVGNQHKPMPASF